MSILGSFKKIFTGTPEGPWVQLSQGTPGYSQRNELSPDAYRVFDGEQFDGGFGDTSIYDVIDYQLLRRRSSQLFRENLYARGVIRRLITNEINTGLWPAVAPRAEIIPGLDEAAAIDWGQQIEAQWATYANDKRVCDYRQASTMGQLMAYARQEALIDGDVLVVLRYDSRASVDRVQLITADKVVTPMSAELADDGREIFEGVEHTSDGRHLGFWVMQKGDLEPKRIAARGRGGREVAFMVYGTDKRYNQHRGEPLLSLLLQSLREIDRYRSSAQRKAVINSMLAMFIEKTQEKIGSGPMGNAAKKNVQHKGADDPANRTLNVSNLLPGVVLDELQVGEKPVGFRPDGTDINFAAFEASIVQAVAWACEMPGEILTLAFANNYSASAAAINEFKIYLIKIRDQFSKQFCVPIYNAWLYNELIAGRVRAPQLFLAWNDTTQYQLVGAWRSVTWLGPVKPSTDQVKQVRALRESLELGLISYEAASREYNGTSWRSNMMRQRSEVAILQEVRGEFDNPIQQIAQNPGNGAQNAVFADVIAESVADLIGAPQNGTDSNNPNQ